MPDFYCGLDLGQVRDYSALAVVSPSREYLEARERRAEIEEHYERLARACLMDHCEGSGTSESSHLTTRESRKSALSGTHSSPFRIRQTHPRGRGLEGADQLSFALRSERGRTLEENPLPEKSYVVRHLQRFPLGTSYRTIIQDYRRGGALCPRAGTLEG